MVDGIILYYSRKFNRKSEKSAEFAGTTAMAGAQKTAPAFTDAVSLQETNPVYTVCYLCCSRILAKHSLQ